MKLDVFKRLIILSLLPETGSYTNLTLVRKAREALSFSEYEHKVLKLREIPDGEGGVTMDWNPDNVQEKEIELGDVVTGLVVDALKKLDGKGELTEEHMPLYEMFVLKEGKEQ